MIAGTGLVAIVSLLLALAGAGGAATEQAGADSQAARPVTTSKIGLNHNETLVSDAAPAEDKKGPRRFYLTTTRHFGNQALSACAAGYHTASLWEILDPTGLRYDTELGLTQADSGSGPPSSFGGWVRTGFNPGASLSPGSANCRAWTSAGSTDLGTVVSLHNLWETDAVKIISPWFASTFACDSEVRVWCVED